MCACDKQRTTTLTKHCRNVCVCRRDQRGARAHAEAQSGKLRLTCERARQQRARARALALLMSSLRSGTATDEAVFCCRAHMSHRFSEPTRAHFARARLQLGARALVSASASAISADGLCVAASRGALACALGATADVAAAAAATKWQRGGATAPTAENPVRARTHAHATHTHTC